jgi:hypothetical protein
MIELLAWQRRALFFLNFLHRTRVLSTVAGRPSGRQGLLLWATPTAVRFIFSLFQRRVSYNDCQTAFP